jgi:predicted permease
MRQLLDDLRHAARGILRARSFTLTAALTLALGIGAVTALVSVLDALLFRAPAGVTEPERVVRVYFEHQSALVGTWRNSRVSYPDFTDLGSVGALEAVAAVRASSGSLGLGVEAAPVAVHGVTGRYFGLLGTAPLAGRLLTPEDDRRGAGAPVMVLSERLWRTRYGADPAVVGRTVMLDGRAFTVAGIAPAGFDGGEMDAADLWVPFETLAGQTPGGNEMHTDRGWYFIALLGRLAPGTTRVAAEEEASAVILAGRTRDDEMNGFQRVEFGPVLEAAGPDFGTQAELARWLAAMSVVVLLIACANVANLLLARGLARAREFAVRKAIGAGQGRLVRQLVAEGTLTALVGGVFGIFLAVWGGGVLRGYILPPAVAERFGLDARVLGIALGATLLAALGSSVVPAIQVARRDLTAFLKDGARGSGARRSRLRAGLVVAQVALSVLLVVGAGLFARSLRQVLAVDIGYDRDRVLIVEVDPGRVGFDGPAIGAAFERLAEAARAFPGVEIVALTHGEPFGHSYATSLRAEGLDSLPRLSSGGPYIMEVTGEYFRTLGLGVLRGRGFNDTERRPAPAVALIGATMAARLFKGIDPIGRCLYVGGGTEPRCTEVVGIVEDGIRYSPREEPQALYYVPLPPADSTTRHLTLFVRAAGDPKALAPALRSHLQAAVPGLPYVSISSLEEVLEGSYHDFRLGATLFGLYAGVALLLAALGLYSVMAYTVRGRRQELGIRLALGAAPQSLITLVVRDGLGLALLGVTVGVMLAVAGGRFVESLLYGISPWDPTTILLAALAALAAAVLASAIPARRAARTDPMTALRSE